ncbi:low molecular weight protein-tyrosine-phosphatase [Acinetobacter sp. P1(2025)]|uniref:low molecular weight protein-tyrosine-phosphatase n=1 Tax=Acinetobacter sp. P1(2025) TaxID=3446120 RepID=UPI003F530E7B
MHFQNILVVCVGNICRSPMAAYFLKQLCPDKKISSAGISAMVGHPADEKAQQAMQNFGIAMHDHIAQQLNSELLQKADLILVMSNRQQQHIERQWPFVKGKIYRLGHWQSTNIADPYQHDQSVFNESCELIQRCVNDWKQRI